MTGFPRRTILLLSNPPRNRFPPRDTKEKAMSRLASRVLAACLSFAGIAAAPTAGLAADPVRAAYGPAGASALACAEGNVLSRIADRFRHQVTHVPHLPDVGIVDFRDIRQNRYLPAYADRPIARRYCEATAYLSDGRRHPIWYLIEEGAGFAGMGTNVEFCMVAFDRWNVYNARCRVLR